MLSVASLPTRPALLSAGLPLASTFLLALLFASTPRESAAAPDPTLLWRIGNTDGRNLDFALAPQSYQQFKDDAFFVVGRSDPKLDWPYVHPGPADGWAGSRRHSFTITFNLRAAPTSGDARLVVDLLDTHASSPPRLEVSINGEATALDLPAGGGDASVYGDTSRCKPYSWSLPFEARRLRTGANEITLTTLRGSWALYDGLRLEVPAGVELLPGPAGTQLGRITLPGHWLRDGPNSVQPLEVVLRHSGPPADAIFRLDRREIARARLDHGGAFTVQARVPAEDSTRVLPLTVTVGDRLVGETNLTLAPPRLRDIWVLPHSHVDVGYTHLQDEIVRIQIANLEQAMELAARSADRPPGERFKWNPEAIWSLDHFLRQASPEKREAFLAAVRRGDVGVDALYGNMLTGLCRPEELAQCLSFGPKLATLTGKPVESAAICDVPGWTWGIVPTMARAGVKYFAIGPNQSARIGSIHRWDNRPFYWKSQSGLDRVLCWVVDNYHHLGDLESHTLAHASALAAADFPYDMSFIYWVGAWPDGGVDNAPPDPKLVDKVVAWNAKYAAPRLNIGLAGDFFRAFEQRHGARVPEFSGDLTPYWEDGAGSTSRETGLNRASAERLVQAEAILARFAPARRPAARFEETWKNVLLYSEHTWGAHNSISAPDLPFVTNQWRIKQSFALGADQQSQELLQIALTLAAGQVVEPSPTDRQPLAVDVFNATQWTRTDLALVPQALSRDATSVHTTPAGPRIPSQRLASGELAFLAIDLPPFGARRFFLGNDGPPPTLTGTAGTSASLATTPTVRNSRLRLELDPTGAIRSLRRTGDAWEFVDPQAPVGLNDFRYVLGPDAAHARTNGPVEFTVTDSGPLVTTLRIRGTAPGCRELVRELRLVEGLDHVDVVNHVDRLPVREKDSVHFGFGFHVPDATVRMETPWAVVRPNTDQLPGACRNWFTVQRWVDVSNAERGITWAPIDAPLVEVGRLTANLMGEVRLDEWLPEAPASSTLYSWAQNNHWFTNYKADQPGVTSFRYRLRPHAGGYSAAAAARFGLESTRPLLVVAARGPQPPAAPPFALSTEDVLVETLKVSEDGRALVLHLFGVGGVSREVEFTGIGGPLWLSDLGEKPVRQLGSKIPVPAYGFVVVRAELH